MPQPRGHGLPWTLRGRPPEHVDLAVGEPGGPASRSLAERRVRPTACTAVDRPADRAGRRPTSAVEHGGGLGTGQRGPVRTVLHEGAEDVRGGQDRCLGAERVGTGCRGGSPIRPGARGARRRGRRAGAAAPAGPGSARTDRGAAGRAPLVGRLRPGLVPDPVADPDAAEVVHQRGVAERVPRRGRARAFAAAAAERATRGRARARRGACRRRSRPPLEEMVQRACGYRSGRGSAARNASHGSSGRAARIRARRRGRRRRPGGRTRAPPGDTMSRTASMPPRRSHTSTSRASDGTRTAIGTASPASPAG